MCALLGFGTALLWVAARPLATDDTWWHLAMGRLYAAGDLWPRQDPLLHTTVLRAPVPHEWLFQIALFHLFALTGFDGLRVFHGLAVAAVLGAAFALFLRAGRDAALAALSTLVFAALCWFRLVQLRPELLSVLAIVALYALVLRPRAAAGPGRVAAALALMLLWANAHSLFAIGLCLLVAALLGTLLEATLLRRASGAPEAIRAVRVRNAARGRRLALTLALAIGVTWLNPRGFAQHLTFVTESQAGLIWKIRDDFLAWHPFAPPWDAGPVFTPLAWALAGALYASLLAVATWRGARFLRTRRLDALARLDPVHLGLGLAAGVASLVAVRFHWLSLFPLLYLLHGWRDAAPARRDAAGRLAAVAALALALAIPWTGRFGAFVQELRREPGGYAAPWMDERYAGPGMRFLADAQLEGRLYHPFNLGGFLGFWLAPRLRTFIDGRLDHVPPVVLDDYLAIRRASRDGPTRPLRERLDRWGVDLFFADAYPEAWYAGRQSGQHLRRLPEWLPIFASRTHVIYLRRNPRNRANLERVVAYYAQRGVPFDLERGLRVDRALREAPDWARENRLALDDAPALWARTRAGDVAAAETLADHDYRIGDFEAGIVLDRALLALDPTAEAPALRLSDALLLTGHPREALRVAEQAAAVHPDDRRVQRALARARQAADPGA